MQDDDRRKLPALAHRAARLLTLCILAIFYLMGVVAGAVTVAAVAIAAAVRLGWTDTRKRGRHGPA